MSESSESGFLPSETESEAVTDAQLASKEKVKPSDSMNAISEDVARARSFKLAAAVDDVDDNIVIDLLHYKDNLDKELFAINNRYSKELNDIELARKRMRASCLERRILERQKVIEKTLQKLRNDKMPTLIDAIYKQYYGSKSDASSSQQQLSPTVAVGGGGGGGGGDGGGGGVGAGSSILTAQPQSHTAAAPGRKKRGRRIMAPRYKNELEKVLTYIDEAAIEEDIKELRRGIAEYEANQLMNTLLAHSEKLLAEMEKRTRDPIEEEQEKEEKE